MKFTMDRSFLRYWAAAFAVMLGFAIILSFVFTSEVKEDLVDTSHAFARMIHEDLNEHFDDVMKEQAGENWTLKDLDVAARQALRAALENESVHFDINDVYVFNLDRMCLFSLQGSGEGERTNETHGFRAAREGRYSTELESARSMHHFQEHLQAIELLESYSPIYRLGQDGKPVGEPVGILEFYQDGSLITVRVSEARWRVVGLSIVVILLLFGMMFFVSVQSNRIIRGQAGTLSETNRKLGAAYKNMSRMKSRLEVAVRDRSKLLVEQEKLAAMGTLAAGVAHEINSPIGIIATGCEGLLERVTGRPVIRGDERRELIEYLEIIRDECFRCKEITRGLLNFSKSSQDFDTEIISMREIVDWVVNLAGTQAKEENKFLVVDDRTNGNDLVAVNGNELKQVIFNVVGNALDAVSEEGRVRVRIMRTNNKVVVECHDDGPGIPQEVLPKVFDPFFTTKKAGEGTGIGLSVAYGILKKHKGTIRIESRPKVHGTDVIIELPASSKGKS